jgi:hypothetical protein
MPERGSKLGAKNKWTTVLCEALEPITQVKVRSTLFHEIFFVFLRRFQCLDYVEVPFQIRTWPRSNMSEEFYRCVNPLVVPDTSAILNPINR